MSKLAQQAYFHATHTVAKTRQVVMLYDGIISFLKQAKDAIAEKRIEDRFLLLQRASKVITGLQSSIDFEKGGDIANILHSFYTNMSMRILSINFEREGAALCDTLIEEIKQMRDVWENIDRNLNTPEVLQEMANLPANSSGESSITLSA